ncbi:MAG: hypothetical protein QM796_11490 [Chthoniobacteraceae bacterium]
MELVKPLWLEMVTNASINPSTVPSRPISGAMKAMVLSTVRLRSRRGTSNWPASCTISFNSARGASWRMIAAWMTRATGPGVTAHSCRASGEVAALDQIGDAAEQISDDNGGAVEIEKPFEKHGKRDHRAEDEQPHQRAASLHKLNHPRFIVHDVK